MVHIVYSFEPFPLKVALDRQATDLPWPPGPPPTEPRKIRQGSSVDLRVACGDSHSTFSFSVFKYPANQTEGSKAKTKQVTRAPFTLSNPLIWIQSTSGCGLESRLTTRMSVCFTVYTQRDSSSD